MTDSAREAILKTLSDINKLPAIPEVVVRVLQLVNQKSGNAENLAKLINEDPSLAANVLKLVNSALYGAQVKEITSIKAAVTRLGSAEVSRLCMSLGVAKVFSGMGSGIRHKEFWKHSLAVGIAARMIQSERDSADDSLGEVVFTAGLLHDVGAFILDQFFNELFAEVQKAVKEEDRSAYGIEWERLGIDHGEVGGILLGHWGLPEDIVAAVSWHHAPEKAKDEHRRVAYLIYLADQLCNEIGLSFDYETAEEAVRPEALSELGVDMLDLPQLTERIGEEAQKSEMFSSLI